jgi:hypothetical protein
VQHQYALTLRALHRNKAHVGPGRRLADSRLVNGSVTASGVLLVEEATAGLFPLDTMNPLQPLPAQFQLAVTGLTGQCAFCPAGFVLQATGGTLRRPRRSAGETCPATAMMQQTHA